MKHETKKKALLFAIITVTVFLSRVPFLGAGYGKDPDSWRVVDAARRIAANGEYSASRFPGYPVQEIAYSLISEQGPIMFNGLTALLSALGIAFFALSLKRLRSGNIIWATFALACTPLIYINSTTSMDYLWALSFILGGFYFILERRFIIAGILVGIAIGCRITSAVMLIPFMFVIAGSEDRRTTLVSLAGFGIAAVFVAMLAFVPVIMKYGWIFLSHYGDYYPSVDAIIRGMTVEIWGRTGLLGIFLSAVLMLLFPKERWQVRSFPSIMARREVQMSGLAIGLYLGVYLWLPREAGYLIPIVPFGILLMNRYLSRRIFIFLCVGVILSPFGHICRSNTICPGPVITDHTDRGKQAEYVHDIITKVEKLNKKAVVVVGWWLPQIEISLGRKSPVTAEYIYSIDESGLKKYSSEGHLIYYLSGIPEFNKNVHGVDLIGQGGRPLMGIDTP